MEDDIVVNATVEIDEKDLMDHELETMDSDTNFSSNEAGSDEKDLVEHEMEGSVVPIENRMVETPEPGMMFDSDNDVHHFYTNYARHVGFGVKRRTSRKQSDGRLKYFTLSCIQTGSSRSKINNPSRPKPTAKTGCKAKICVTLCPDGMYKITTVVLEHNHALSPGKVRHFKGNKKLDSVVQGRFELNDQVGLSMNTNFHSFIVEAGGYEKFALSGKDCRNYIEKAGRLRLGSGDGEAMHNYFMKMQAKNHNFFYVMDLDEECCVRNLFWADARSRAAYEAFGDVITFDTTYLTNMYDMPLVSFVGVNHHGHSVLFGCGLLSNEDIGAFVWLFQSWLACMSGRPPKAVVTDQCKAMQRAVELVFPEARHRWCLWYIMKKLPEKLGGCPQYGFIKSSLQDVVYDSLTKDEFDESWKKMIEKYALHNNDWLEALYDYRHRWVPTYVRNTFWAGMSTTQRSDSVHPIFDGYVNPKTTLKQFLEQYDSVLRSEVEKENIADYSSFKSRCECISHYDIEKQFQETYTNTKFKEFQDELSAKMYCYTSLVKVEGPVSTWRVLEHASVNGKQKDLMFTVHFDEVEAEMQCMCHLFEFKGILCRHVLAVLTYKRVKMVPSKYVLSRWRMDLTRGHAFVRSSCNDAGSRPHAQRYNSMCNLFYGIAELAADDDEKYETVLRGLRELKAKVFNGEPVCESSRPTQNAYIAP